jgi:hypothetical protein
VPLGTRVSLCTILVLYSTQRACGPQISDFVCRTWSRRIALLGPTSETVSANWISEFHHWRFNVFTDILVLSWSLGAAGPSPVVSTHGDRLCAELLLPDPPQILALSVPSATKCSRRFAVFCEKIRAGALCEPFIDVLIPLAGAPSHDCQDHRVSTRSPTFWSSGERFDR